MKRILCFGDSNTYGYIPGGLGRYDEEVRWTGRLQKKVASDTVIVEEGLCGRTTVFPDALRPGRRGSELLPILLESQAPLDMVILMLGTNDCKTVYGASAAVIARGMEYLIGQVKASLPNTQILVISPIRLGENVWKSEYDPEFSKESVGVSKGLREEFEKIAQRNGCQFLAASDYAAPSVADQEHLDEQGHAALANAIYTVIAPAYNN